MHDSSVTPPVLPYLQISFCLQVVSKLHQLLKPFMLRRMKADVEIFLPRKQEILLYAPMSEEQQKINKQLLDKTLGVSGDFYTRGRGGQLSPDSICAA